MTGPEQDIDYLFGKIMAGREKGEPLVKFLRRQYGLEGAHYNRLSACCGKGWIFPAAFQTFYDLGVFDDEDLELYKALKKKRRQKDKQPARALSRLGVLSEWISIRIKNEARQRGMSVAKMMELGDAEKPTKIAGMVNQAARKGVLPSMDVILDLSFVLEKWEVALLIYEKAEEKESEYGDLLAYVKDDLPDWYREERNMRKEIQRTEQLLRG